MAKLVLAMIVLHMEIEEEPILMKKFIVKKVVNLEILILKQC
tara:strand:+ start:449 stop:574 length:126 start_codon:yes stop_codon:yes gene_type:complete